MKGNSKFGKFVKDVMNFTDNHSREIKLGLTIAGVILTAAASANAGIKANQIMKEQKQKIDDLNNYEIDMPDDQYEKEKRDITIETIKRMAPVVLPPVIIGGATICSAISGYNSATKQLAAISAAYSISEAKLSDYTDKAKELLGDKKVQEVKDAVGQDKVINNPPKQNTIISTGKGNVLCLDDYSGRYFYSDAESIRKATNNINKRLMDEYFISLNDYYDELGLPDIGMGHDLGFAIDDGMIEPTFSTSITADDRPCLVLNYVVSPKYGYGDYSGKFRR